MISLGFNFGIGTALGLLLVYYIWREIRGLMQTRLAVRLHKAGFNWAKGPQGWLNRDPHNDDWILWHEESQRMFRGTDPDPEWRLSGETLEECIALGEKYEKLLKAQSNQT